MPRLIFILFLCISALPAIAQVPASGSKVATLFNVDGRPLTTEEFVYLFKKNHPRQEDFTQPKVMEYLDLLVNFKLKVAEARNEGIDTTAAFLKEFHSYRDELKKPYLAEKNEVERLTREAYARLKEEIKASHILISVTQDAKPDDTLSAYNKAIKVRQRLVNGEDFNKVANEVSEDPSAKMNGGNLGYFTVLQMVYPFEEAAYRLKPGEISNPVRTRFGYHIIKVFDRRPSKGEVEVSHIILRTGAGDHTVVKNKIFEIYNQLQAGRGWDELCKEYSDDPSTKDRGGRLRPFGAGVMASVPEFEAVAFSLEKPGEISDPFQSAYGWHIIRLERKIPVPSFEESAPALGRKIGRDERLQLAEARVLEKRKAENGFKEYPLTVDQMMALADTSLTKGKWIYRGQPGLLSERLFSIGGHDFSVNHFVQFIRQQQTISSLTPSGFMKQLYDRCIEEAVDEAEDAKLRESNVDYRNLIKEYEEGLLLFNVMEEHVWNKASADTTGLKQYYERNKSKFQAGERLEVRMFSSMDRAFLDEVKAKMAKGDTLSGRDMKRFKSVIPLRRYSRGDHPVVDRISWITGLKETTLDNTFYLVDVQRLVPPGTKEFGEIKAQIISDYQEELEKQWVAELKQKYQVKINGKARKSVITELTNH